MRRLYQISQQAGEKQRFVWFSNQTVSKDSQQHFFNTMIIISCSEVSLKQGGGIFPFVVAYMPLQKTLVQLILLCLQTQQIKAL